jgi:hypothetical protein
VAGPDEKTGQWRDMLIWRVPRDDESHYGFNVNLIHLEGEQARDYQARQAHAGPPRPDTLQSHIEKILAGEEQVWEVTDQRNMVNLQDGVALCGQGPIAPREDDHLGRGDVLVRLMRAIYRRELRAFRDGLPLKQWTRPIGVRATAGVPTSPS